MMTTIAESTRQLVADRIKMGGELNADLGRTPDRGATPPPRGKDRSR